MNKVCILGSMNMDLVLNINELPQIGETILSQSFEKIPGGKGANQAIAASRSGAQVAMISKIGNDDHGRALKNELIVDEVDARFVASHDAEPTGIAMIMVNGSGNNSIIVVSGANMTINEEEIDQAMEGLADYDIFVAQFETPEAMTLRAFQQAKQLAMLTILNPAPARAISDELLAVTDIIIPNETEAEVLTGIKVDTIEDAKKAGEVFVAKGVSYAIITLGSRGAAIISKDFCEVVPAFKVNATDTTAAGDSFIGGFSSTLEINNINKDTLVKAVAFGNKVSSIAVQRKGAQPSIPYRSEVIEIYGEE